MKIRVTTLFVKLVLCILKYAYRWDIDMFDAGNIGRSHIIRIALLHLPTGKRQVLTP